MKRSDVTGDRFEWELGEKQSYIRPPPPHFIVSASLVTTMEIKAIEFHRIATFIHIFVYPVYVHVSEKCETDNDKT